jgi:hypothetical protein
MSERKGKSISALAVASGLKRHQISTLLVEHDIPRVELGNHTLVLPEGMDRLMRVMARFPGVNESFVNAN